MKVSYLRFVCGVSQEVEVVMSIGSMLFPNRIRTADSFGDMLDKKSGNKSLSTKTQEHLISALNRESGLARPLCQLIVSDAARLKSGGVINSAEYASRYPIDGWLPVIDPSRDDEDAPKVPQSVLEKERKDLLEYSELRAKYINTADKLRDKLLQGKSSTPSSPLQGMLARCELLGKYSSGPTPVAAELEAARGKYNSKSEGGKNVLFKRVEILEFSPQDEINVPNDNGALKEPLKSALKGSGQIATVGVVNVEDSSARL